MKEGIDLTAAPGETVSLSAVGSDPDGDSLSYKWWRYHEADTCQSAESKKASEIGDGLLLDLEREPEKDETIDGIELEGADQAEMSFTVPEDARSGDTIHMIAEVRDDSQYNLVRYQRVVITVK